MSAFDDWKRERNDPVAQYAKQRLNRDAQEKANADAEALGQFLGLIIVGAFKLPFKIYRWYKK